MNMKSKSKSFEDLTTIRKFMEESSRFLSLSGLSGIFAGMIALAGGAVAYLAILRGSFPNGFAFLPELTVRTTGKVRNLLILDSLLVLICAIAVSIFFSYRKSKQLGLKIWTPVSKRMLVNILVPLTTGGLFTIVIAFEQQWQLIVPSMLIFYGLALVNAGKYTYNEVFYLGIFEIIIGLVSSLFPSLALLFWCLGFGILHITYGLIMYRKYEK